MQDAVGDEEEVVALAVEVAEPLPRVAAAEDKEEVVPLAAKSK